MFHIKKHERIPALIAFLFIIALHTLNVMKYYDRFSVVTDNYRSLFSENFHISGFDPFTYTTVSRWDVLYEVTRHPLMAFWMYVPAQVNQWLITLTDTNCAIIIVGILWALCAFYAFLFLFRILHELQGVSIKSACLLCAIFYSFGYTMLSVFVPDHFGPSVMLLLMTIYIIGKKDKEGKEIGLWQSLTLFILTAGVSLSNGIKVFLAAWINKGRHFFKPRYLACAVVIPSILIFAFAQLEQQVFIQPRLDKAAAIKKEKDKKFRADIYKAYRDTATNLDSATVEIGVKKIIRQRILKKYREDHKQPWNKHKGKALTKTGFGSWTDISTPRWPSLVENIMGEPTQMHEDYFLKDVLRSRPVIVEYRHWYNYLAEAILTLLFMAGIFVSRRSKVTWTVLSFFAFDILLHWVLGFGINEVYIMSPHYLFIIPIVIAPLLSSGTRAVRVSAMTTTILLTIWFAYWNLSLLLHFLLTTI